MNKRQSYKGFSTGARRFDSYFAGIQPAISASQDLVIAMNIFADLDEANRESVFRKSFEPKRRQLGTRRASVTYYTVNGCQSAELIGRDGKKIDVDIQGLEETFYTAIAKTYVNIDPVTFATIVQEGVHKTWGLTPGPQNFDSRLHPSWLGYLARSDYQFRHEHIIPILIISDLLGISREFGLNQDDVHRNNILNIPINPNGALQSAWLAKRIILDNLARLTSQMTGKTQALPELPADMHALFNWPADFSLDDWETEPNVGPFAALTLADRTTAIFSMIFKSEIEIQHLGRVSKEAPNLVWQVMAPNAERFDKMLAVLDQLELGQTGGYSWQEDEAREFLSKALGNRKGGKHNTDIKRLADAFDVKPTEIAAFLSTDPNHDPAQIGMLDQFNLLSAAFANYLTIIFPDAFISRSAAVLEQDRKGVLARILDGTYHKITTQDNMLIVTAADGERFLWPGHPVNHNRKLESTPPNHILLSEQFESQRREVENFFRGRELPPIPQFTLPQAPRLLSPPTLSSEDAEALEIVKFGLSDLWPALELLSFLSPTDQERAQNQLGNAWNALQQLPRASATVDPYMQALIGLLWPYADEAGANSHAGSAEESMTLWGFLEIVTGATTFIRQQYEFIQKQDELDRQRASLQASIVPCVRYIEDILSLLNEGTGFGAVQDTVLGTLTPYAHRLKELGADALADQILDPHAERIPESSDTITGEIATLEAVRDTLNDITETLRTLANQPNLAGLRLLVLEAKDQRESSSIRTARRYIERTNRIKENVKFCRDAMSNADPNISVAAIAAFAELHYGPRMMPRSRVEEILQLTSKAVDVSFQETQVFRKIIQEIQGGKLRVVHHGHNKAEIIYNLEYHIPGDRKYLSLDGHAYVAFSDPHDSNLIYFECNGIRRGVNTANGFPRTQEQRTKALAQLEKAIIPILRDVGAMLDEQSSDQIPSLAADILERRDFFDTRIIRIAEDLAALQENDDAKNKHDALLGGLREMRAELRRQDISVRPLGLLDISDSVDPNVCAQRGLAQLQVQGDTAVALELARTLMGKYGLSDTALGVYLEREYSRADVPESGYRDALCSSIGISLGRQSLVAKRVLGVLADIETRDLEIGCHHNGNQEILFPLDYLAKQNLDPALIAIGGKVFRCATKPLAPDTATTSLLIEHDGHTWSVPFPRTPADYRRPDPTLPSSTPAP